MIHFHEVTKTYAGAVTAVDRLSLEVVQGELLVLLGESGCGKTTTLKMVNRLIEPTSGRIEVDGEATDQINPVTLRRRIGYVFQGVGLFPHLTVGENVAVTPRLLKWSKADIADRVRQLLELVNLPADEYAHRYPQALSGGQQQRVGVARALAARPKIMLMDEPFGALDPLTRDDLRSEYARIHRRLELTTVMVTHDMTEALLMADRIAVMQNGRMLQIGRPHDLLTAPADDYVRALMDSPRQQADALEQLTRNNGQ